MIPYYGYKLVIQSSDLSSFEQCNPHPLPLSTMESK